MILKGNNRILLITLNTSPNVNPTMVKGRSMSHTSGSNTIRISASGQHITNKIHHRMRAIRVFILQSISHNLAKEGPIGKFSGFAVNDALCAVDLPFLYTGVYTDEHP